MKFYTTVFLPPTPPEQVLEAVTGAMAPYDYNAAAEGEWDRWDLPSWHGFTLKPGYERSPRALHGTDPDGHPLVSAAPLELLDLSAMTADSRAYAEGAWDAWAEVRAAHPPALPRSRFETQDDYLAQPAVQAVAQAAASYEHPYFDFPLLLADPVTVFAEEREVYAARVAARSMVTHACLTRDGRWRSEETGGRGWDAHAAEMTDLLVTEPPRTVVVRLYCHI